MHLAKQKEEYLSSSGKNLDEHLRNELNHDDPPWRTPVQKDDEIELRDERDKIKALWWYRWRFLRDDQGELGTPEGKE